VTVNYSRVHLLGSAIIGVVIALAPTVLLYQVGAGKLGAFIFFLPAASWQRVYSYGPEIDY
jgi:hypothetical protein